MTRSRVRSPILAMAPLWALFVPTWPATIARADEPVAPPPYEGADGSEMTVPPADDQAPTAPPDSPPPEMIPLPPPDPAASNPQAPPVNAAPPSDVPDGQWTYTSQYGWLWTPYEQTYTQVYPDSAVAYTFVYYPAAAGWRWLTAPWILGVGPRPYWGAPGVRRFAWYAHPWFRVRGGAPARGFRPGTTPAAAVRGSAGGGRAPAGDRSFGGGHFSGGHSSGGHSSGGRGHR